MSDKENKRKCFKCGSSPIEDGIKLFRFLKPGTRNLLRCAQWAKYIFPEREPTIELQRKLYSEHRVLCERHFKDEDFTDASKKKILRSAVPSDVEHGLPIYSMEPSTSQQKVPLMDVTNVEMKPEAGSSSKQTNTEKENILFTKSSKYLKKICQLQRQMKKMKDKKVLDTIMNDKFVKKLQEKNSPTFALLLQGQIRNCKRKLRGRRWTKEEKITALRIYKRSPTCYRLLRRLFSLPSESTLKNLLNKMPFDIGCNKAVFKVLQKFIKTQKPVDNQYILMLDEMSLRKHLDYNIKHDQIEGFEDHGTQGRTDKIAGYSLVFMIAGIRVRVKQPIAHYFSSSFSTADRLAVLIKEVLQHCSEAGVNIAAIVCDMDGVNRRALSILGATTDRPYITYEGKDIVTMYDTPHLLKCFRNLFMKYDIECTTNINSSGKKGRGVAKWSHIEKFYEMDSNNPNFVYATTLKKDHLNPNSKQKMKVNLAAQVLSHTVAGGMFSKIADGTLPAQATVTAYVVSNMDKLFDALNSDSSDLRRGKPCATNLSATSPHLSLFKEMKDFFSSLKFVGAPRKPPSQEGWIWTINAIEMLWRNMVQKYKIKALATRRLQQDPLENLFGCIRGNCGSNANPTCGQFVAGLKTAVLSNLSHIGTKGNCESDNNIIINNFNTMLSVSQPTATHTQQSDTEVSFSAPSDILPFEIEEALNDNTSEIQACAYVCGFIIKQLPIKDCEICKKIFVAEKIDLCHLFVENKEYNDTKKSLNYATKELIACLEMCATIINTCLDEKPHIKMLKMSIIENVKNTVNFDFTSKCTIHNDKNKDIILNSAFMICVKKFCIMKNRTFGAEAASSSLQRKMKIILHK